MVALACGRRAPCDSCRNRSPTACLPGASPRSRSSPARRPGCSSPPRPPAGRPPHRRRPARACSSRATCSSSTTTRVLPARLRLQQGDGRAGRGAAARAGRGPARARRWSARPPGRARERCCSTAATRSSRSARRGPDGERAIRLLAPLVEPRHRAAAALHRRAAGRPRALPDGLRRPSPARSRRRRPGSTSPTTVLDACRARGRRGGDRRAGGGPGDVQADHRRAASRTTGCTPSATPSRAATIDAVRGGAPGGRGGHHDGARARVGGAGRSAGRTDLFIRAPFEFRVVDVLLTNFHMPRSSLLVLLDAFCGPRWRDAVRRARWPRATASCPSATPCWSRRAVTLDCARSTRPTAPARAGDGDAPRGARSARRASCRSARAARCGRCRRPTSRPSAPRCVLANTYHLMLRPGADVVARARRHPRLRRLARPRAHRLGRLPGVLARRRRSTTTA